MYQDFAALDLLSAGRDFLCPKHPGGAGFTVTRQQFEHGMRPGQHLMIGTTEHLTAELAELHDAVHFDRVQALVDWGGLPEAAVRDSLHRLGEEIAPALRRHIETVTPAVAVG